MMYFYHEAVDAAIVVEFSFDHAEDLNTFRYSRTDRYCSTRAYYTIAGFLRINQTEVLDTKCPLMSCPSPIGTQGMPN